MNEDKIFDIEFEYENKAYKGWVNPSDDLNADGLPSSFHVVLNEVSFAHLSYNNGKWVADAQRPSGLIDEAGNKISKKYNPDSTE
jgi:hypothetical protein